MSINFKHTISANNMDQAIDIITQKLKTLEFGILTQIDFSVKMKEKVGADLPKTIILGACNPKIAYEVYKINQEFLSLLPCNVVVREMGNNQYQIEIIKPSKMVEPLNNSQINQLAEPMDSQIHELLTSII